MLNKVTLTNFQAHKFLELELDKFTTLTGGSNSGKSAVLRAIIALVRNDSATDYVRYGQKSLSVVLTFSDGYAVEWIKGSGENKYILTSPDGTVQTFDKVGADVPEEVKEVLKLGPIAIKGSDKEYINFHSQLEAPFMISATPGAVAKLFGELTSASQLYSAVNEGNRRVRSTNSIKATRTTDIRAVLKSLEDFEDLAKQEDLLSQAQAAIDDATLVESSITDIESVVSAIVSIDGRTPELEKAISTTEATTQVQFDELESISADIESISSSLERYEELSSNITKGEKGVLYLEVSVAHDLDTLDHIFSSLSELESLLAAHAEKETGIGGLNTEIASATTAIEALDSEIDTLVDSTDTCVECGQELSEEAKELIKEGKVAPCSPLNC